MAPEKKQLIAIFWPREKKQLIANKGLESILQIDGATSDINVHPNFGRKNIEMSVTLGAPQDRKVRPQITWLKNQIKNCGRKNPELFSTIENELMIDINIKFIRNPVRIPLSELEYVYEKPEVDEKNKTTIINSRSNVSITPELISSIRAKIAALREQVIG